MTQPRVIIMAGGTGGHIFPGLAVARGLAAKGWQIHWLGSNNGMEQSLVPTAEISLHLVSVQGLRGKGISGWLKAPWMLIKAVLEAKKIFKKNQIQLAIGFGGFASGPGGLASVLSGVPLLLHEQNAKAGMTNRRLARFAKIVFEGFPGTFDQNLVKKIQTVGNPVRDEILSIRKLVSERNETRVLVIGGSRGAQALNEYLPDIFKPLLDEQKLDVWHQSGKGKLEFTQLKYAQMKQVKVVEFIDDMRAAYEWADLIICRAGASTVAEVAAVGLAAVFVPFPHAVDDHQAANASWLVQTGGASMIRQAELEAGEQGLIHAWARKTPAELFELGKKNKQQAFINATEAMVNVCEDYRYEIDRSEAA